eukprot:m.26680 g.26680  ORF g.26680 m.26680 type:complete len:177 (-) comp8859_c0_seq1:711-1241(-)
MLAELLGVATQNTSNSHQIVEEVEIPSLQEESTLKDILEYYAENADVVMCCCIILTLGPEMCSAVAESRQSDWMFSFLELLERLQLFSERAFVISRCQLDEVKDLSKQSTDVKARCEVCRREFDAQGQCQCPFSFGVQCSVCRLPVRDLYVWCRVSVSFEHTFHLTEIPLLRFMYI